jgi:formylglycine-generating enzyme required for sulfatase activity
LQKNKQNNKPIPSKKLSSGKKSFLAYKKLIFATSFLFLAVATGFFLIFFDTKSPSEVACQKTTKKAPKNEMVWVEGGTFMMGSNKAYPDEKSTHKVTIDGFWIDKYEVTNVQFAKFIEETGHVTVAERVPNPDEIVGAPPEMYKPGSAVFTPPAQGSDKKDARWWSYIAGANWKHPEGPESSIHGKENYPAVHIAFEDAQSYAKWAGHTLPTEAQFEFAARSKLEGETYAWGGKEVAPEGEFKANTWQGHFPFVNTIEDGYEGIAPVGCFDANSYGAYDLIGNVWEWTGNWYKPSHDDKEEVNPTGPLSKDSYDPRQGMFPVRVIKGGSFLCAENYCMRYRPSARHAQDTGLGANHIGFRTVLAK